jgi:hypothetical protein
LYKRRRHVAGGQALLWPVAFFKGLEPGCKLIDGSLLSGLGDEVGAGVALDAVGLPRESAHAPIDAEHDVELVIEAALDGFEARGELGAKG